MSANVVRMPPAVPQRFEDVQPPRDRALCRRVSAGLLMSALLLFGVGGWAAMAKLSGAVIAAGLVVIDSNIKKVQHPTGGIVGELRVQNGAVVRSGDVVIRLDDTQTRAGLGIVTAQLAALAGRRARLEAEAIGQGEILFPELAKEFGVHGQAVLDGERRLFQARRKQRQAQKDQLRSRIGQLAREIEGLQTQQVAKTEELKLIDIESSRVQQLHDQHLVPETRLLAIRRDRTRIAGEHGTLTAQIARTQGQISETELQILNVDQTVQSEAQGELRDIESRIAELLERRVAAEDQLKRVDIKAPIDGTVHELAIYTVGGVISAAETLMLIVPSGDPLMVEVRLSQTDIDQVVVGQPTRLRFAAFNHRTTPEVSGSVSRIAADLSRDPQSGQTFYVARIRVDDRAHLALGDLKLVPGMPVEAFIETDERTVLSYIVKPFADQLTRAMREE